MIERKRKRKKKKREERDRERKEKKNERGNCVEVESGKAAEAGLKFEAQLGF